MNDDFLNIKDQQVFYMLKEYLEKADVQASVIESSAEIPVNLLIALTREEVSVNIMYVPLPEDHFTEIRLLQFYTTISMNSDPGKRPDLVVLLNELNNQSPIGAFVLNAKGELGFKYIFPVSRFELPQEDGFIETFSLYLNCLTGLRNVILHVNNGDLSLSDALRDVMAG